MLSLRVRRAISTRVPKGLQHMVLWVVVWFTLTFLLSTLIRRILWGGDGSGEALDLYLDVDMDHAWEDHWGYPTGMNGSEDVWQERQAQVREAFIDAWSRYRREAWGADEHFPLSHSGKNLSTSGGIGFNIIDSMDTLILMNLQEEYAEAREWALSLSFDVPVEVNLFETTIRVLAGLLSCYHLTGALDVPLLKKASDLGDRLLGAFSTASGIPANAVNLRTREPLTHGQLSSVSEVSSLQLEFRALSQATGDPRYARAVDRVMRVLQAEEKLDGLVPMFIDPDTGKYVDSMVTLGARGDSYYEYLLKQWVQLNGTDPSMLAMYDRAVEGIRRRLMRRTRPHGLLFVGEMLGVGSGLFIGKMDHLACFYPGVLALGALLKEAWSDRPGVIRREEEEGGWAMKGWEGMEGERMTRSIPTEEADQARELGDMCWEMYRRSRTGLAPEIVHLPREGDHTWSLVSHHTKDFYVKPLDAHSLLRPETVESFFLLYRQTGSEVWRERGWRIMKSILQYARLPPDQGGGYTSLENVDEVPPPRRDKLETFFFSETLKYLYLLFGSREILPLDKYVLNTEAHPLPIFTPGD